MNDIEIIKNIIYSDNGAKMEYIDINNILDNECKDFIEAIENLIQRNKDLEQIEKEHKEENERLRKEIDNKDNTIEQLQKEAGYKKCKLCKKVFKAKRKNQIYCSERCCNIVMCRNYKRRNRDKTLTYAKEYYKKMKSNKVEEDK